MKLFPLFFITLFYSSMPLSGMEKTPIENSTKETSLSPSAYLYTYGVCLRKVIDEYKLQEIIEKSTSSLKTTEHLEYKLEKIEQLLVQRKKEMLCSMKKHYQTAHTKYDWRVDKEIDQRLQKYENTHKHIPIPGFYHDPEVPQDILLMIKENLAHAAINPERINIGIAGGSDYTIVPVPLHYNIDDHFGICEIKELDPGKIFISSKILSLSLKEQEGWCILAVNHLLGSHIFKCGSCPKNERMCRPIIIDDLALQILSLALRNGHNARRLKKYCSNVFSSNFSFNDYLILSKIDRLHKGLAQLKTMER